MLNQRICCLALLAACCASHTAFGGCRVESEEFVTAEGGCLDLNTGLVWGPDLRAFDGVSEAGQSQGNVDNLCDRFMNDIPENGGGYTDWRAVTLGEVADALIHGLNDHLDFFLDGSPDDGVYRWTACEKKVKGTINGYAVRFSDADVVLTFIGGPHMICVRGLPADLVNDCPDSKGGGKGGGRGGGKDKSSSGGLSQMSTGALLFLPLAMVLALPCVRPRRP